MTNTRQSATAAAHKRRRGAPASASKKRRTAGKPSTQLVTGTSGAGKGPTLLSLPKELRLLIWEHLIEDQAVNVLCNIFRIPKYPREPALARASDALRAEVLAVHYSRSAFHFNMDERGVVRKISRLLRRIARSDNLQYLHKFTVYGDAKGGQVDVTLDFGRGIVRDARRRNHQNGMRPEVPKQHYHLISDVDQFKAALSKQATGLDKERDREVAIDALIPLLPKFFRVPKSCAGRWKGFARSPHEFNNDAVGPCQCSVLVAPVEALPSEPKVSDTS